MITVRACVMALLQLQRHFLRYPKHSSTHITSAFHWSKKHMQTLTSKSSVFSTVDRLIAKVLFIMSSIDNGLKLGEVLGVEDVQRDCKHMQLTTQIVLVYIMSTLNTINIPSLEYHLFLFHWHTHILPPTKNQDYTAHVVKKIGISLWYCSHTMSHSLRLANLPAIK